MVVYHASPYLFVKPDYDQLCSNLTGADNGLLGLWVAPTVSWITKFGRYVYKIDLHEPKVQDLSVETLRVWSDRGRAFHIAQRLAYLEQGVQYLRLVEADGRSDMGVIVDFEAIASMALEKL